MANAGLPPRSYERKSYGARDPISPGLRRQLGAGMPPRGMNQNELRRYYMSTPDQVIGSPPDRKRATEDFIRERNDWIKANPSSNAAWDSVGREQESSRRAQERAWENQEARKEMLNNNSLQQYQQSLIDRNKVGAGGLQVNTLVDNIARRKQVEDEAEERRRLRELESQQRAQRIDQDRERMWAKQERAKDRYRATQENYNLSADARQAQDRSRRSRAVDDIRRYGVSSDPQYNIRHMGGNPAFTAARDYYQTQEDRRNQEWAAGESARLRAQRQGKLRDIYGPY